jgi:hypothetical protein
MAMTHKANNNSVKISPIFADSGFIKFIDQLHSGKNCSKVLVGWISTDQGGSVPITLLKSYRLGCGH